MTPRVAANIPIRIGLDSGTEPIAGYTRDIGVGGLCAVTDSAVQPSDIRFVEIPFPDRPTRLAAEGRWQSRAEDGGSVLTGLAFQELEASDSFFIWTFVQTRALDIVRFLYHQSEIAPLGLADLLDVALFSRLRSVPAAGVISGSGQSNEVGDSVFIVFRGSASLRLRPDSSDEAISVELPEGAVFGGLRSLLHLDASEVAWASSDVMLLELDRFSLAWLEASRPVLVVDFAKEVSRLHEARCTGAFRDGSGPREIRTHEASRAR